MALMSDVPNGLFDTAVHVKPPLEGAAVGVAACVGVGVGVDAGSGVGSAPLFLLLPRLQATKANASAAIRMIKINLDVFIMAP
jgi:hypothetical protein